MRLHELYESKCPHCGGPVAESKELAEKQDACYHKVKSRYKVWPSAYASGALVQCRKAGAANWGNKSESIEEELNCEHGKYYCSTDKKWKCRQGPKQTREGVSTMREFAPDDSGDSGDDGFDEETLRRMAAQWYNGDEDPGIERALAAAGWEIGQDEGYDDEPGVFVVQAGDVNGNSYLSWPADELRQGVAEGLEQHVPPVLYHATYKPRLKSIKLKGLGAGGKRNWEDSRRGVIYLALDPNVAESYAESSDMVPDEWLDQIVILKISTAGLDPNKFNIDGNVQDNEGDTVEYHGVIPLTNISLYKQGVAEGQRRFNNVYDDDLYAVDPKTKEIIAHLGNPYNDKKAVLIKKREHEQQGHLVMSGQRAKAGRRVEEGQYKKLSAEEKLQRALERERAKRPPAGTSHLDRLLAAQASAEKKKTQPIGENQFSRASINDDDLYAVDPKTMKIVAYLGNPYKNSATEMMKQKHERLGHLIMTGMRAKFGSMGVKFDEQQEAEEKLDESHTVEVVISDGGRQQRRRVKVGPGTRDIKSSILKYYARLGLPVISINGQRVSAA